MHLKVERSFIQGRKNLIPRSLENQGFQVQVSNEDFASLGSLFKLEHECNLGYIFINASLVLVFKLYKVFLIRATVG